VSIVIKKEESPIVVPLHISADEEIKREERSPLPSLQYPSTSHRSGPSSRLSSYRTRSPALRFSPIRRGDSLDSTYHPATPIRSPTPLEQPIDWEPVRQHGAVTDTTLVPSSASSRTRINPIGYALRRVFVPSEVSDLIREGLQLGIQQRAEEEHRQQIWQRVLEARARVEERLNREERIPPHHPPFPNLVPRRWFRGAPPRPALRNRIAPLRPRELLRLPARFRQDYTRH
jgi:Arc/MetJ-type ribon-helix-helix transcriptional regulator